MNSIELFIKLYYFCAEYYNGEKFYYKDVKKRNWNFQFTVLFIRLFVMKEKHRFSIQSSNL